MGLECLHAGIRLEPDEGPWLLSILIAVISQISILFSHLFDQLLGNWSGLLDAIGLHFENYEDVDVVGMFTVLGVCWFVAVGWVRGMRTVRSFAFHLRYFNDVNSISLHKAVAEITSWQHFQPSTF